MSSVRLLGLCVLVLGVVSVKFYINHLFRSAIVRGGAADVLQCVNIARINNAGLAVYTCNRYAVFVYRPSCIVQFGINLLSQGYVAAAAELVIKVTVSPSCSRNRPFSSTTSPLPRLEENTA